MKAFRIMLKTELKLSLRGMDMLIFATGFPVVIMFVLGIVYGSKPAYEGSQYTFLQQSFGAVSAIAIGASGMMGLPLVIADYRNKKILKRFKVTPISPIMILIVQVIINLMYTVFSLFLVYLVGAIFFGLRINGSWALFLVAYFLVILSIYSIGMLVGAVAPNIKTSNLLCSILYFPMIIFSGTTLPYEVMPQVLQKISDVLPLTQGIKLLKAAFLGLPAGEVVLSISVMVIIAAVCIAGSLRFFRWE